MDQLTPDDEFDRLLRDWAQKQPPVPTNELRTWARILAATTKPIVAARSRRRLVWSALAVIAVAASALVLIGRNALPPQQHLRTEQEAAAFPRAHLETLAKESRALFDRRVRWFAETNQELLFGIDDSVEADSSPPPNVAVRVVVFRRKRGSTQWNESWRTNVVLRADEPVHIDLPRDRSQLRLWAHVLPDQAVVVDSDFRQTDHHSADWQVSTTPLAKKPELVVAAEDGAEEVQVWQSAMILGEDAL